MEGMLTVNDMPNYKYNNSEQILGGRIAKKSDQQDNKKISSEFLKMGLSGQDISKLPPIL
jgi:hypothetical protein